MSVIKFKNEDFLLVHEDEIEEDNSPVQTSIVTDDDMNHRLNALRDQTVADLTVKIKEVAKDANNGLLGTQTVWSTTISSCTPKLGIRKESCNQWKCINETLSNLRCRNGHKSICKSSSRCNIKQPDEWHQPFQTI